MTVNSSCCPLVTGQFLRLIRGDPDEVFARSKSCQGRKSAAKLLGKEIVKLAIQTPFYVLYDLGLLIYKIGELAIRTFSALCVKASTRAKLKPVFYQTLDYLLLFPLLPVVQLAKITKLIAAILINPKFHYKLPKTFPAEEQGAYYRRLSLNILNTMLSSQDEMEIEMRGALHQLEQAVVFLGGALKTPEDKCEFFKRCHRRIVDFQTTLTAQKLKGFRLFLLKFAAEKEIPLKIPFPI